MPPKRLKHVFGTKQHAYTVMRELVVTMNRGVEETDDYFLCANDNGVFASRNGRRVYMFELVDDNTNVCHECTDVNDEKTKLEELGRLQEENEKLREYAIQMLDVLSGVNLGYHYGAQELYEEVSGFLGRWE